MKKKFYQITIPVQRAKEIGFKEVEKEAKEKLKEMYPKEQWNGATIVADVQGINLVFTMRVENEK